MKDYTPMELFTSGYNAMNNNDFLNAEKYFLASLYAYSKTKEDEYYHVLLGCIDKLSLYLYPKGHFENKERALEFYKMFSRVDKNASYGYAMALINGVFGEPDYTEAIKQMSKAEFRDQIFIMGYLLNEGKGIKQDREKAAMFMKSNLLVASGKSKQALEIYDSIGIEIDLSDEELTKEIKNELKNIFKENFIEFEKQPIDKDWIVREFFKNSKNIPNIDIQTNEVLKTDKYESDDEDTYQIKNIQSIYDHATMSPVFKKNAKYSINEFKNMMPYIAYNDILNYMYIIRARPSNVFNSFDTEERTIIKEYNSIEEMVKDGWRLD